MNGRDKSSLNYRLDKTAITFRLLRRVISIIQTFLWYHLYIFFFSSFSLSFAGLAFYFSGTGSFTIVRYYLSRSLISSLSRPVLSRLTSTLSNESDQLSFKRTSCKHRRLFTMNFQQLLPFIRFGSKDELFLVRCFSSSCPVNGNKSWVVCSFVLEFNFLFTLLFYRLELSLSFFLRSFTWYSFEISREGTIRIEGIDKSEKNEA